MLQQKYLFAVLALLALCSSAHAADNVQPYAANLFQGNFAQNKEGAVIAPGDRVVVRLWGGDLNVDRTLAVGPDGHMNLPEVGDMPVAG
ncbi:polysaccharide biosynthesis/export family protein, partial [Desulfovibrio sp. 1188_IL3213]|uniref:polysaccharide biosynthesis/export family protein n=1 Tax=Desulfovibrio sp. 1188_IL3213 TaxID=3084052 RepID=UPI002FDB66A7